jgi:adenylosuccinate synthase
LLDVNVGLRPNTTQLDTTNHFAIELAKDPVRIGVAKAFSSRHGFGVFPTFDEELNVRVQDDNQETLFWNGSIKFGWFDAVLLRYAKMVNPIDELYISSLDKLNGVDEIKVCDRYLYTGTKDDKFERLFDYVEEDGKAIVVNIRQSDPELAAYLEHCCPIYSVAAGWERCVVDQALSDTCRKYIKLLEQMVGVPITVVSVGETREHKIRI